MDERERLLALGKAKLEAMRQNGSIERFRQERLNSAQPAIDIHEPTTNQNGTAASEPQYLQEQSSRSSPAAVLPNYAVRHSAGLETYDALNRLGRPALTVSQLDSRKPDFDAVRVERRIPHAESDAGVGTRHIGGSSVEDGVLSAEDQALIDQVSRLEQLSAEHQALQVRFAATEAANRVLQEKLEVIRQKEMHERVELPLLASEELRLENGSLRTQLHSLTAENARLSRLVASLSVSVEPSLTSVRTSHESSKGDGLVRAGVSAKTTDDNCLNTSTSMVDSQRENGKLEGESGAVEEDEGEEEDDDVVVGALVGAMRWIPLVSRLFQPGPQAKPTRQPVFVSATTAPAVNNRSLSSVEAENFVTAKFIDIQEND